jgi:alkylated DNA nucleotide flippase Atl1
VVTPHLGSNPIDALSWADVGCVTDLWLRTAFDSPILPRRSLTFISGLGIAGDCHCDSTSPRQVLLASNSTYAKLYLPAGALSENVTISTPLDDLRPGSLVALGPSVLLRITFRCEPCARLNKKRHGLLREIGQDRGLLARVIHGGEVVVDDRVEVLTSVFPDLPDDWQTRVQAVAMAVPSGSVIEYAQLARIAGVPITYCRVFPRTLSALGSDVRRRVVSAGEQSQIPRWRGSTFHAEVERSSIAHCPRLASNLQSYSANLGALL